MRNLKSLKQHPARILKYCITTLQVAAVITTSCLTLPSLAADAGWRSITTPGPTADAPPVPVMLYYPSKATERVIPMGPFTVNVAPGAQPDAQIKGLILLSHGTGGSELGHTSLAQALAQNGYLVAALRHAGDNWQDQSLLTQEGGARFFTERPKQASRVIDAILSDELWRSKIASDTSGFKVGAIGHSAGGYTAIALAGGDADTNQIRSHCEANRAVDPIFCGMGPKVDATTASASGNQTQPLGTAGSLKDSRVRAVVALSPLGVPFSAASLASVKVPTLIYHAEKDRFLVTRFHGDWIAKNMPSAQYRPVPNAWHFAFMDKPTSPIGSADGDVGADPRGFDRPAFLKQLGRDISVFFDTAMK